MIKVLKNFIVANDIVKITTEIDSLKLIEAYGFRRRSGENKTKNLSQYSFLKKRDFSKKLDSLLLQTLPENLMQNYLQVQLLHFNKGEFLDKQTVWKENLKSQKLEVPPIAGFLSICLRHNQKIIVEDTMYTLNKGDCIIFYPEDVHEVKKTIQKESWMVFLLPKPFLEKHYHA